MAYIGKSIESGTFSVLDTSGNTYNGSNVTFNLGTQVGSVAQLLVSHDGVLQKPGTDYTLATGGTQITFTTAPASGASIFIVEISGAVGGPLDSDLNGTELILDADGDTSITADTDDQIDFKIAGADDLKMTANAINVLSGTTLTVDSGATITNSGTANGFGTDPDGAQVFNESGADVDFRVESNGETDMIFADGGLSAVGINCSPAVRDTNGGSDNSNSVYGLQVAGASGATAKVAIGSNGAINGYIGFAQVNAGGLNINTARIEGQMDTTTAGSEAGSLELYTMESGSIAQRMKIAADGDVLIAKTSLNATTTGHELKASGQAVHTENSSGDVVMIINRQGDDGSLISFKQANSQEGNIAVSGATVAYNTFCGTHWSRLADNSKPTILRGTVIESISTLMDWYQVEYTKDSKTLTEYIGALPSGKSVGDSHKITVDDIEYTGTISKEENERSPMCKISDTEDSKAIYGVFLDWDVHDDKVNDMYVASLGSFVVRIHKDETVAIGDYLQSKGDGTAKKQADDILRSSTIAKVTSTTKTHTHADGSYCVPCTLHCG